MHIGIILGDSKFEKKGVKTGFGTTFNQTINKIYPIVKWDESKLEKIPKLTRFAANVTFDLP